VLFDRAPRAIDRHERLALSLLLALPAALGHDCDVRRTVRPPPDPFGGCADANASEVSLHVSAVESDLVHHLPVALAGLHVAAHGSFRFGAALIAFDPRVKTSNGSARLSRRIASLTPAQQRTVARPLRQLSATGCSAMEVLEYDGCEASGDSHHRSSPLQTLFGDQADRPMSGAAPFARAKGVYCGANRERVLDTFAMANATSQAAAQAVAQCEAACGANGACTVCSVDCPNGRLCQWVALEACGDVHVWSGMILGDVSAHSARVALDTFRRLRRRRLYKTSAQVAALLSGAWRFRSRFVLHLDANIRLLSPAGGSVGASPLESWWRAARARFARHGTLTVHFDRCDNCGLGCTTDSIPPGGRKALTQAAAALDDPQLGDPTVPQSRLARLSPPLRLAWQNVRAPPRSRQLRPRATLPLRVAGGAVVAADRSLRRRRRRH
jgi:hypothetical protein